MAKSEKQVALAFDMLKINHHLLKNLVFASPFFYVAYFFRFELFGIPFTAVEGFIYVLFSMWLISMMKKHQDVAWDTRTKWFWLAAFLFFIGASIGAFFAPNFIDLPSGETLNAKQTALGIWKGWVVAPMLYFVVVSQVLRTEADVKKILRMFMYGAGAISLIAFALGLWGEGITIDFRLRGFYESANYLSLYLVPAILINAYLVLTRNPKAKKTNLLDLSNLTIITYSLFFTKSYAAIIGVFGGLGLYALYFLMTKPRHAKKIITALVGLVVIFMGIVLSQLNTPKFQQFLDFENRSSSTVRIEIYQTALHLIQEQPFKGVGPGLFQAHYQNAAPEVLKRAPLEWNMPHSHNIVLGFWINAGLLGLLGFLILVILAHRSFTYPLIALWGTLIHGMFDMPFWKNDLAMIFWLLLATILILQKHGAHRPQKQTG